MTTKQEKSPRTGKGVNNGGNSSMPSFVQCELSDQQKQYVKTHPMEQAVVDDSIDNLLRAGFKLSMRFDEKSLSYALWLTGPQGHASCGGLVLSARGPSVSTAYWVLLYKHFEVLKENWGASDGSSTQRDTWG